MSPRICGSTALRVVVNVDQQKAASLGVTFDDIRRTLFSAYGSEQVATIYTSTDDYAVILEVSQRLSAFSRLYKPAVRNR